LRVSLHVDLLDHWYVLEVFIQDPTGLRSPTSDVHRDLVVNSELKQVLERREPIRLDVFAQVRLH